MKTLLKTLALTLLAMPLWGQMYMDENALNFTMLSLNGNARYVGMGGAMGALGGNLSTLSTNPGGIGIYRNGEFSFTPALTIGQTHTTPADDKKRMGEQWNFNLGNLGWVGVIDLSSSDSKNEMKKIQIGIGLNRQADFWNQSKYNRFAAGGETYLDVLTATANEDGLDSDIYSGLAHDAGLILQDTAYYGDWDYHNDLEYYDDVDGEWYNSGVQQRQTTKTTGAINEWVFSVGGNYGDRLFWGATIGIPSVNYKVTRNLIEENADEYNLNFNNWKLQEKLEISGTGINLKLGMIYKPVDFVRVGLAFHTPTRYNLKEKLTINVNGDTWIAEHKENINEYDFHLRTPARLIISTGIIIAKKASIGIEYEHFNYGNMLLDDEWGSYDADNDYIFETYGKGGTLKVGAEYRFDPVCVRAGYNYTLSPYEDNSFNDFSQQSISAGLGFNLGSMMLDLAYVNTFRNYKYMPYPCQSVNQYKTSGQQFVITMGWRF